MSRTIGRPARMRQGPHRACVALCLILTIEACDSPPGSTAGLAPTAPGRMVACGDQITGCPDPAPSSDPLDPGGPTMSLEMYYGPAASAVPCPANVAGVISVPYHGKVWTSLNGPYHSVGRTLTTTRYQSNSGQVSVFGDLRAPWSGGGARATAVSWEVTCFQVGPNSVALIDPSSFSPNGWFVTYDPDSPPPGGGGGGGDGCDYQIIYDPSTCDPWGGGGGGGGGGGDPWVDPGDGGGGGGGGGGSLCTQLQLDPGCYDVYIDDVYDSTICC
jgi:hypothetical protein